ncbi:hypothetical protein [Bilophila wadsworthia]|uniref:hypothetical protein n=1 Tax=Bilophila wadsworthia TaxID=35833 RepID=UPI002673FE43|nr:hypothetical protein [Bilophila wadsworthia]
MNNITVAGLVFLYGAGLIFSGYVQGRKDASSKYELVLVKEKNAHEQTQALLQAALNKGMEWKTAYEEMRVTADACRDTAEACLARENDWQNALEQQESVFRETSVHPRTPEEQTHVVDDATRRKAAVVLNTGW